MDLASVCGSLAPLRVWNPDENDFGICFTQLVFTIPTHVILAAVSAFFAGALAGQQGDSMVVACNDPFQTIENRRWEMNHL